jgi:hypothetical protein
VREALALDELHRHEELAVGQLPTLVKLDGVGVLQRRDGARLPEEALHDLVVLGQVGLKRLDGHRTNPVAELLLALVDLAHPAFADDPDDAVPPLGDARAHKRVVGFAHRPRVFRRAHARCSGGTIRSPLPLIFSSIHLPTTAVGIVP